MLVPFVDATRIFVGAGHTGANGNYYWGLHEFADMAFVLHYLRPDDLFVDVGANVGSYTLLASGAVGARTIAFEPVPQTLARLRANCDANGLGTRVDVRAVCVGASAGTRGVLNQRGYDESRRSQMTTCALPFRYPCDGSTPRLGRRRPLSRSTRKAPTTTY
jgi:FkbM family methyltransferase